MTKFALFGKKDLQRAEKRVDNFINSLPLVKKRHRWLVFLDFFNIFSYFVYSALILVIVFVVFNILVFKNIYSSAFSGKNYLEASIYYSKNNDYNSAMENSLKAEKNFESAGNGLEEIKKNYFIGKFENTKEQLNDLEYIMSTGEILSRAVYRGASLGSKLDEVMQGKIALSYSKFSAEQKERILKFIYESGPEIYGIKASLDLGLINLEQFEGRGILGLFNSRIEDLKGQLEYASNLLAKTVPLTEIIPYLAGYPGQTNFLVVLQNSDELRPTGGFIGTYGVLEMNKGEINNFKTHDVYHMDMPVKDKLKLEPPAPIKKYLIDKWFMRDANWSPDWPTSARQIEWFYQKEYDLLPAKDKLDKFKGDTDGVIGITPALASNLLKIIGPVSINGEEFNSQNFHSLLQYEVEVGYATDGVSNWQRKEIIGELFKQIKIKLLDLPSSRWQEVYKVLADNFFKKNILVYFNDDRFKNYAEFLNWDGRIMDTAGDYLMVVDANFGSYKTDAVMDKKIAYKIEENKGVLNSNLSLSYAHLGGFDWRTTKYRSYTRIYVPKGSVLIKGRGDFEGEVETGEELDKTYFGLFLTVQPGKSSLINIQYKLPENIKNQIKLDKKYSLFAQKQPGRATNQFAVDLKFDNGVKSYKPAGFNVVSNKKEISWKTDWETDKAFEVNF